MHICVNNRYIFQVGRFIFIVLETMIIVVIICVHMKTRSAVNRFVILLFPQTFESFEPISKNRGKNINKELI